MYDWVMVPRDKLEKLAKLTAFNTSALAANVSSWAKNLLAAAPQQAAEASEIQHPCDVPGLCAKMNRKCDQCDPQQQADAGHSCSYYCTRPECVRAQRDELRDRLEAQQTAEPVHHDARITTAQIEQIKRLADEYARSYIENGSALMELAPQMYDNMCDERDEARAALHAALDALVKE